MKQKTIVILFLFFTGSVFSQGIEFRHGSWEEMLSLARKENKMVFTDFYTSWCGPCKMMAKEIFVRQEVGNFFNRNFICYKLDAEKEDGKPVARRYQIGSYPTFLFVDGEGNRFYCFSGYMEEEQFLAEAKNALQEFRTDKKTMEKWDAEYLRKKDNAAFVWKYMEKRGKLKLDNADVLDQYFRIAKKKTWMNRDFLKDLCSYQAQINAGGECFGFMREHLPEILKLTEMEKGDVFFAWQMSVMDYSMQKAIRLKDKTILEDVLQVNPYFCEYSGMNPEEKGLELICDYNYGIRDEQAFEESARELAGYYRTNGRKELDSLTQRQDYAGKLMDVAQKAAYLSKNQDFLLESLSWAVEAVTLWDHFSTEEVIAEVFYALGRKNDALDWMEKARTKAIRDMKSEDGFAKIMKNKIQKMEKGMPLGF